MQMCLLMSGQAGNQCSTSAAACTYTENVVHPIQYISLFMYACPSFLINLCFPLIIYFMCVCMCERGEGETLPVFLWVSFHVHKWGRFLTYFHGETGCACACHELCVARPRSIPWNKKLSGIFQKLNDCTFELSRCIVPIFQTGINATKSVQQVGICTSGRVNTVPVRTGPICNFFTLQAIQLWNALTSHPQASL